MSVEAEAHEAALTEDPLVVAPHVGRQLTIVTIGLMLSMFLIALDQTIVGTALPRIVAELEGLSYYSWVLTAYLVASTIMTPISGKLGDLFGRKPLLLTGMIGFVLASALCGQAQNMAELVAFRGLQGIFGGMVFSTIFASIADLYTFERRGTIQGVFAGIYGIASVVGPTIGGYLTDSIGWRWVFYVNVPVGVIAIAFVLFTMPRIRTVATWRDIDFFGAGALIAGLLPLLIAFSITNDHSWGSFEVLGLMGVGVALLIAFYFIERGQEHPIVPFGLFKNRTFSVSVAVSFLIAVGFFGVIIFMPLLYQGVLGVGATNSGLLLTPMMLGLVTGSVVSGQLMNRLKHYRFIGTVAIALLVAGIFALAQVNAETPQGLVAGILIVVGFGVGNTFPLYVNASQNAVERQYVGVVTSQVQFFRNIGSTMGIAILGSVLSKQLPTNVIAKIDALGLPPQARQLIPQGSANPQALFDPTAIAAMRANVPAQAQSVFDQVILATRAALGVTLHDLFLVAAGITVIALVSSVFLHEVEIKRVPKGELSA